MAGLSPSPTPGKGFTRDGPGARALFYCHCVFRDFQESPGKPYSHLQAATCSVGPQGCRRCLGPKGREGKKGKAMGCFPSRLLRSGSKEKKKDTVCVGGRSLGSSPRLMFQVPGQGMGMQSEMEGWARQGSWRGLPGPGGISAVHGAPAGWVSVAWTQTWTSSPRPEVPQALGSFFHVNPNYPSANKAGFPFSSFGNFPAIFIPSFLHSLTNIY